ncbi:hypothetical protein STRNTR1_3792 [Stenotrophomonas maltophilia]|nr:hypothetical protein STRNTR1_3792 [Stenotrophomonas maltophilia]
MAGDGGWGRGSVRDGGCLPIGGMRETTENKGKMRAGLAKK